MSSSAGCAFCAIVSGQAEAALVFETEELLAFLDRRPLFKGHTLLVPRAHLETLTDVPPHLLAPLLSATQRLAGAMTEALGAQGSFVAMNNRVSQSVPHLHVHVVPRTKGDGLRGFFWPRHRYEDGEMSAYAARLRSALAVTS